VYAKAVSRFPHGDPARRLVLHRVRATLLKIAIVIGMPRLLNAFFPIAMLLKKNKEDIDPEPVITNWFITDEVKQRAYEYGSFVHGSDWAMMSEATDKFAPEICTFSSLSSLSFLHSLFKSGDRRVPKQFKR
jgi:hypothetical protein